MKSCLIKFELKCYTPNGTYKEEVTRLVSGLETMHWYDLVKDAKVAIENEYKGEPHKRHASILEVIKLDE
jgi:hypothetical protein